MFERLRGQRGEAQPGEKANCEEPADAFEDMLLAAETSLDFWNNPIDDEDWNDA